MMNSIEDGELHHMDGESAYHALTEIRMLQDLLVAMTVHSLGADFSNVCFIAHIAIDL